MARSRKSPLTEVGTEPDARFSFANERTFLAWIRTAMAFVATGLAVVTLLPALGSEAVTVALGCAFVAVGSAMSATAYGRWERAQRALRLAQPLPPPTFGAVVAYGVAALGTAVVVIAVLQALP